MSSHATPNEPLPDAQGRRIRSPRGLGRTLRASVLGLLVTVLLLEGVLQAAAFVFRIGQGRLRPPAPSTEAAREYRVVCLGESTTHGYHQESYPKILEEELNRRGLGVRFRVINGGYPGRHTSYLLARLRELIDKHRPHMVITMMGVADKLYFQEADTLRIPVDVQVALLESRLYRLIRLLWFYATQGPPTEASAAGAVSEAQEDRARLHYAGTAPRRGESPAEREQRLLAFIKTAREGARPGGKGGTLDIPAELLRAYYASYRLLEDLYGERGQPEAAVALYEEAIRHQPKAEYFYRRLSVLYEQQGKTELAARYTALSEDLARTHVVRITRANYQSVRRLLKEKGISYVAMQYPLRSIETLRFILDNADDVTYVENRQTFREAIARSSYDELFVDRVAGDFGHCSAKGNRLIAENLIATVFVPMFSQRKESSG